MDSYKLNKIELRVMEVLWTTDHITSQEIALRLREINVTFGTLQFALRMLNNRKIIGHTRRCNKYLYFPLINKTEYALGDIEEILLRYFGGDPARLVSFMIGNEKLNHIDLQLFFSGEKTSPPGK